MFSLGTNLLATCLIGGAMLLSGSNFGLDREDLGLVFIGAKTASTSHPLPVKEGMDGRMYMDIMINGNTVPVIVDTAATHTVLSAHDAKLLAIKSEGHTQILTAGGKSKAQQATVDSILIENSELRDHRVLVIENLPVSLLGADVLRQMDGYYIPL